MLRLGTTFSQIQCDYLHLDYSETLTAILTLPFNYIRVSAYWNEIEPQQGSFNFEKLDKIIHEVEKNNKKIILAVGMKTPRWPEFHFPQWIKENFNTKLAHIPLDTQAGLSDHAIDFIKCVLERYANSPAIEYIQIENEAFNNFGFTENKFISYAFVRRAVSLARVLSPGKKIMLTNAINLEPVDLWGRYNTAFKQNISLADVIGTNVYTKVPINKNYYIQPTWLYWWKLARWHKKMQQNGIEPWITEAQSEPWEYQNAVHIDKESYPSSSPQRTKELIAKLQKIGFENILLWGCEYWYWHKSQGREEWWSSIMLLDTV